MKRREIFHRSIYGSTIASFRGEISFRRPKRDRCGFVGAGWQGATDSPSGRLLWQATVTGLRRLTWKPVTPSSVGLTGEGDPGARQVAVLSEERSNPTRVSASVTERAGGITRGLSTVEQSLASLEQP